MTSTELKNRIRNGFRQIFEGPLCQGDHEIMDQAVAAFAEYAGPAPMKRHALPLDGWNGALNLAVTGLYYLAVRDNEGFDSSDLCEDFIAIWRTEF